jgi:hypothetical protein
MFVRNDMDNIRVCAITGITTLDHSTIPCTATDLQNYFEKWCSVGGDEAFSVKISDMEERFCSFVVKSFHAKPEIEWLVDVNRILDAIKAADLPHTVKFQDWIEVEYEGTLHRYDVDIGTRMIDVGIGKGFSIGHMEIPVDEIESHIRDSF